MTAFFHRIRARLPLVWLALPLVLSGCGGDAIDPGAPLAAAPRLGIINFDRINDWFLNVGGCAAATCHDVNGFGGGSFKMIPQPFAALQADPALLDQQRLLFEEHVDFANFLNSRLLVRPSQANHGGGVKFNVGDPIYDCLIGWFNGVVESNCP